MTATIGASCALPGCPRIRLTPAQIQGFVDNKNRPAISYDCHTCGNTTYKDVNPTEAAALIRVGVHFQNDNPIPTREIRDFEIALGAIDTLVGRLERETTR